MPGDLHELVTQWAAVWNTHDLDRLGQFYAQTYQGIDIARSSSYRGRAGLRRVYQGYLIAFPDLHMTVEQLVVESTQAAVHWTIRGTHHGQILRIPATGRQIEIQGVSLFTVNNRLFLRGVHIWDLAGLLRQIGLLPDL